MHTHIYPSIHKYTHTHIHPYTHHHHQTHTQTNSSPLRSDLQALGSVSHMVPHLLSSTPITLRLLCPVSLTSEGENASFVSFKKMCLVPGLQLHSVSRTPAFRVHIYSPMSSLCQKRSHLELTSETNSDLSLTQWLLSHSCFQIRQQWLQDYSPLLQAVWGLHSHMMKMGFLTHNKTGEIALS